MSDLAHKLTDEELDALERKIKREYERAGKEVERKAAEYFAAFEKRDAGMLEKVASGKLSKSDYNMWRANQMLTGKRWIALRDTLARELHEINKTAASLMHDPMILSFVWGRNYSAYALEHELGLNLQFTIYNERTVAKLLKDNPRLLPFPKPNAKIDIPWNMTKINSEVTQAILQGESTDKLAARLQTVIGMNEASAFRNAITAMTNAQCKGRYDAFKYAESLGIKMKKQWVATLDDKTRDAHRDLDGQEVDLDDYFTVNGDRIFEPGDERAEGYLVYNCRCDMISKVAGVEDLDPVYRRDNISGELVEDMSYRKWEAAKKNGG